MALIKNKKELTTSDIMSAENVLSAVGLVNSSSGVNDDAQDIQLKHVLERNDFGLDTIVQNLRMLAVNGENETAKMSALRTGLELHRVLKEKNVLNDSNAKIIINVVSDKTQINNLLNPQRN